MSKPDKQRHDKNIISQNKYLRRCRIKKRVSLCHNDKPDNISHKERCDPIYRYCSSGQSQYPLDQTCHLHLIFNTQVPVHAGLSVIFLLFLKKWGNKWGILKNFNLDVDLAFNLLCKKTPDNSDVFRNSFYAWQMSYLNYSILVLICKKVKIKSFSILIILNYIYNRKVSKQK